MKEGEFFTLLGPSGCGKTTLLRIIAGFYSPDEGDIFFGGQKINHIPAHKRETGMVFQNYALFPHLSVFDNVAYGLRAKKTPAGEIQPQVTKMLRSVEMEELAHRFPNQLSGGQQQRVALARSLVISPQVLLMDEPLSNLDAKLRVSMREEIKRIQQELGITTIYVTHDQEEAMAVSDQIAIFNHGKIEQIGTAPEVYLQPKSRFVAEFMGRSNIVVADATGYDDRESLIHAEVHGEHLYLKADKPSTQRITISIRPEWIQIVDDHQAPEQKNLFSGTVVNATFLGSILKYNVSSFVNQILTIEVHDPQNSRIKNEGETLRFRFDATRPVILEN